MPGDDLLSHGESPHYHRRCVVSLPSSGWDRVVPTLYGHQAKLAEVEMFISASGIQILSNSTLDSTRVGSHFVRPNLRLSCISCFTLLLPRMACMLTMQEQLSVLCVWPTSRDGGSSENAGAIFCPNRFGVIWSSLSSH